MKNLNKYFFIEETAGGRGFNIYAIIWKIKIIRFFGRKFKYIKCNGYDFGTFDTRQKAHKALLIKKNQYIQALRDIRR